MLKRCRLWKQLICGFVFEKPDWRRKGEVTTVHTFRDFEPHRWCRGGSRGEGMVWKPEPEAAVALDLRWPLPLPPASPNRASAVNQPQIQQGQGCVPSCWLQAKCTRWAMESLQNLIQRGVFPPKESRLVREQDLDAWEEEGLWHRSKEELKRDSRSNKSARSRP